MYPIVLTTRIPASHSTVSSAEVINDFWAGLSNARDQLELSILNFHSMSSSNWELANLADSGVSACLTVLDHTARVAQHLANKEQNQHSVSDLTLADIRISNHLNDVTFLGIQNIVSFADIVSPCINVPDDQRMLVASALQTEVQRVNQIINQYETNVIRLLHTFSNNPSQNSAEKVRNSRILSEIICLTIGHIADISQVSTDLVSQAQQVTYGQYPIPLIPQLQKLFFIEPMLWMAHRLQNALSQIGSSGPATAPMHPAQASVLAANQASLPLSSQEGAAGESEGESDSAPPPGNLKDDSNY